MSTASPSSEPSIRNPCSPTARGLTLVAAVLAFTCLGLALTARSPWIPAHNATSVHGNLRVRYSIVTLQTDTTRETNGGEIAATRVTYFPTYVLVTESDGTSLLFPVEKLQRFEVARAD